VLYDLYDLAESLFGWVFLLVFLAVWIAPPVIGAKKLERKGYSKHWLWFCLHPLSGWVMLYVVHKAKTKRKCPACCQFLEHTFKVCPFCGEHVAAASSCP